MAQPLPGRGLLIAFEGIDGAGKTTQVRALAASLRAEDYQVVESKEPTNGPWGSKLRASAATGRLSPQDELELFMRDRRDHVRNLIEPGLDRGAIVIVDRYYFSTAAYQGARGMDFEHILALNEEFAPQPDLLFIIEVEPAVGRSRITARGDEANLFENEAALAASAAIFKAMKRPYIRRLDGNQSITELQYAVLLATEDAIKSRTHPSVTPVFGITNGDLRAEADRVMGNESIATEDKPQALLDRLRVSGR